MKKANQIKGRDYEPTGDERKGHGIVYETVSLKPGHSGSWSGKDGHDQ